LGYGPAGGTTFTLDSSGHVPTALPGTQALINGSPAPILFASTYQVDAYLHFRISRAECLAAARTFSQHGLAAQILDARPGKLGRRGEHDLVRDAL
jgi:uncharacterized protein (TIGR03437 family)